MCIKSIRSLLVNHLLSAGCWIYLFIHRKLCIQFLGIVKLEFKTVSNSNQHIDCCISIKWKLFTLPLWHGPRKIDGALLDILLYSGLKCLKLWCDLRTICIWIIVYMYMYLHNYYVLYLTSIYFCMHIYIEMWIKADHLLRFRDRTLQIAFF